MTLKVAVVGAGIGASHIEGYQANPDLFEVTTLADLDAGRRAAVAGRFGIRHQAESFEEILGRDVDVIDICTPSKLHYPQAKAALEAGHHVVIEKPVARSLAEMDDLIATEAKAKGRACPIFQYRFGHGFQKLHHLLAKGLAGRPSVATAETHWSRQADYYRAASWRGTWEGETGGCFTTHAIHIHDMLCEVLGPIASVHARTSRRVNGNETEDMGTLSLQFVSGAMATSSVTLGSRQEISRLRFCFDNLVAESGLDPYNPGHDPWTFPHDDPAKAEAIQAVLADFTPRPERFAGQFQRLHQALTTGGPLPVTLADARRAVELLTAAYWSAHKGATVTLPLGPEHPFYAGWLDILKHEGIDG